MHSEVFVHGGQMGHGIGRVLFDPFSTLVSSVLEDFEVVKAYRQQGLHHCRGAGIGAALTVVFLGIHTRCKGKSLNEPT